MAAAARAALELVADPAVAPYLHARPTALGPAAAAQLERGRDRLLRWAWALLGSGYGVRRGEAFWAVHRPGDPRNCLVLCADEAAARDAARWWVGPPVVVTRVPPDHPLPETYVALGVALQWRRPAWLDGGGGGPQKKSGGFQ